MPSSNDNGNKVDFSTLEELRKKIEENRERLNDISEDITYLTELVMRYIKLSEQGKKVDTILVNVLFFTVGVLLGFAIALLFLKWKK